MAWRFCIYSIIPCDGGGCISALKMQAGCKEDTTDGVQAGAAIGDRIGRTACDFDCAVEVRWKTSDCIAYSIPESNRHRPDERVDTSSCLMDLTEHVDGGGRTSGGIPPIVGSKSPHQCCWQP
jgi:hypothetical protein